MGMSQLRRLGPGVLAATSCAVIAFWLGIWQSDESLFRKTVGDGPQVERVAPSWPGKGVVQFADLGAKVKPLLSRGDLSRMQVWADVCAAFEDVPDPVPGDGPLHSRVVPPVPQGDGTYRAVEVILMREWTGWKLAKVRCGPRERLRQEGKITTISGPETRGRLLYVAGKPLQLPQDAYVKDYVIAVNCSDELPCPEVPFLRIVRGDSMMEIAERSGKIQRERLASGEAGAFDFVREALNN
jgi:hypothetical protein